CRSVLHCPTCPATWRRKNAPQHTTECATVAQSCRGDPGSACVPTDERKPRCIIASSRRAYACCRRDRGVQAQAWNVRGPASAIRNDDFWCPITMNYQLASHPILGG